MHLENHERQEDASCLFSTSCISRLFCTPGLMSSPLVLIACTENSMFQRSILLLGIISKSRWYMSCTAKWLANLLDGYTARHIFFPTYEMCRYKTARQLSVIHAVLTRWMAHYLAFKHLLKLQHPLWALVNHNTIAPPDQLILNPLGGTTANKRKACEMIVIIEDSGFWHSLAQYELYLTSVRV